MLRRSVLILLLALFAAPAAPAQTPAEARPVAKPAVKPKPQPLEKFIDQLLAQPEVARAFWGIEVVSLDTGITLYSRNQNNLFTPASNTKLYTTAAALALIGPDHRFRTTIESTAALDKRGRLLGDLVLVGRGDPNISGRNFPSIMRNERVPPHLKVLEELADQVVARGVKYIDGDVIADDTYYAFQRYPEGWAQDDLTWEWGAPVSALTINDNVVFVKVLPADRAGDRAFVEFDPIGVDYYRVENRIMTTLPGSGPRNIEVSREPGSTRIVLWGTIPADDVGDSFPIAVDNPAEFAARIFRRMLERRGVIIYGNAAGRHAELASLQTLHATATAVAMPGGGTADIPGNLTTPAPQPLVLAAHESQPFLTDLRVINKISQNLHAELALRLLGRVKGNSGTLDSGISVMRNFLAGVGIAPEEYSFYDGSGLSRQNLVTPSATIKLLRYAAAQPWFTDYKQTLPLAGVDGTLRLRFKNTAAEGRVWAKTGTLGHVNALAGYLDTVGGKHLAFSVMVNNHKLGSRRALETLDQIIVALVDDATYTRRDKPESIKKKKKK